MIFRIFTYFKVLMDRIKEAGWTRYPDDDENSINSIKDVDIRAAFRKVDIDKSGTVTRRVRFILFSILAQNLQDKM